MSLRRVRFGAVFVCGLLAPMTACTSDSTSGNDADSGASGAPSNSMSPSDTPSPSGTNAGGQGGMPGATPTTSGAGGANGVDQPGVGGATSPAATGGSGGAGMMLALRCDLPMVAGDAVVATTDLISDFTYTDGTDAVRDASFSFGDYYAAPSGYSFHFPDRIARMCPEPAAGGAGAVDAGPENPVLDASTAAMDDAGASNFMSNADAGMGGATSDAGSPPGEADAGMGEAADASAPSDGPACFTPGLTEDLTGSNWHITGLVNGAAAFAVGTVCNIDASLFDGIEFTIRGNAGNPSQLRVEIGFAGNIQRSFDAAAPGFGTCEAGCVAPSVVIPVTETETVVRLPWDAFLGGSPNPGVDPSAINGINWIFLNGSEETAYEVDVTVDNLRFMSAD